VISPNWYGKHHTEFAQAINNKSAFAVDSMVLILGLVRSVIFSIIAGFVAALIARENTKSPITLGVLILLFGIFTQWIYWNYVPLWYHIPFLLLLIPMTILGGRIRGEN
jgi:uncharacterized membrane protein (DUF485 family)